jgi:hypothetical protein
VERENGVGTSKTKAGNGTHDDEVMKRKPCPKDDDEREQEGTRPYKGP